MGRGHVASGHWTGVAALLAGLVLCLLGVATPWWKVVDEQNDLRLEGLWQLCFSDSLAQCKFSGRNSGLWRAIQVLQIVSLMSLLLGVICSCISATRRTTTTRRCPASSVAALAGGLVGLLADLLYVGYIERHALLLPREHVYAWSFALCVCGAIFSLLAALALCLTPRCCSPRFTSHVVEPYWTYRHYRVAVSPDGSAHYYPYPGPYYPDIKKVWGTGHSGHSSGSGSAAVEKRRQFEKSRNGHVWFAPEGPAGDGCGTGMGPDGKAPPGYTRAREAKHHKHHHSVITSDPTGAGPGQFFVSDSSSSSVLGKTTDRSDDSRCQPRPRAQPGHPGKGGAQDSTVTDSGQESASDSNSRPQYERRSPPSPATVPSVRLPDRQPEGMRVKVRDDRAPFTIQQAMEESRRGTREGGGPRQAEPDQGELLMWQPTPPPSLPPTVYLPQTQTQAQTQEVGGEVESRGRWLPWIRKAGQERVVIKTRSGKLQL